MSVSSRQTVLSPRSPIDGLQSGLSPFVRRLARRVGKSLLARFRTQAAHLRDLYHHRAFGLLLGGNPPPDAGPWLLLGNSATNVASNIGMALIARSLMREGWHAKPLFTGLSCLEAINCPPGDNIARALITAGRNEPSRLAVPDADLIEWHVDYRARTATACGIDFFDAIDATIANHDKIYTADFTRADVVARAEVLRGSIDAALKVARRIEAEARRGQRITLVLMESHVIPNAVLSMYFDNPDRKGLVDCYLIGPSFSWFVSGTLAATTAMLMGNNPLCHPYYASAAEFEPWYMALTPTDHDQIRDFTDRIVTSKRLRDRFGDRTEPAIVKRINEAREAGRPVYCLYSHLFYDRPINDRTPLFPSMLDWISETVEMFRSVDALLLLKPHVVELAIPDAKLPRQRLADFIAGLNPPSNAIVLPPDRFLTNEIAASVDAAIVWRSTAFLEMTIFGVPAVFCGPASPYAEPMRVSAPRTLEEYRNVLLEAPRRRPSRDAEQRARAVLYFLNAIKTVPLDVTRPLPEWLFGQAITFAPLRLAQAIYFGGPRGENFADAVRTRKTAAYFAPAMTLAGSIRPDAAS